MHIADRHGHIFHVFCFNKRNTVNIPTHGNRFFKPLHDDLSFGSIQLTFEMPVHQTGATSQGQTDQNDA